MMSSMPIRVLIALAVITAATWARPAEAKTWLSLSDAELIRRSDLVVEGIVETVFPAPDAAERGSSDMPRAPAEKEVLDAAEVAHVKVIRVLKGNPGRGPVAIVYWSDFGDREHAHFSKYDVPHRLAPGQRRIFALRKRGDQSFTDYSSPLEAREAKWLFALPAFYEAQIQAPAFAAKARRRKR
jgi:hypothetical protein